MLELAGLVGTLLLGWIAWNGLKPALTGVWREIVKEVGK